MKKELIFIIVWELLTFLLLFASYRVLLYLHMQKDNTFEFKYIFLIFAAIIIVYIFIGILLGVLIANIKHFSIIGYLLISVYALYFAIRLPAFYTGSKLVAIIYPNWLIYQRHDFTSSLGGLLLGLIIVNIIRSKTKGLRTTYKSISKMGKNKWIILLFIIITIGIIRINYKTPQKLIIEQCLNLLYSVPKPDERKVLTYDFQEICTEQGLNHIIGNSLDQMFKETAYNGQFTIDIKDIELNKIIELKDMKIVYDYKVKLLVDYNNSNIEKVVFEEGSINLQKVNGEWKVDFIRYKALNNLFTEK